ncbi:MAG: uracil-DNA glycosylase [Acidobacteriota bacterium]
MRRTEFLRYRRDLGWTDCPDLPDALDISSGAESVPDTLDGLSIYLKDCTRCPLSERRKNVVFGEGSPTARLLFVGEGPGAEEDRSGRPFVGQAGRLLDGMITALGLDRRQVYIANVVKCRPPRNRDPQSEEMAVCSSFLDRQIDLIRPEVIVALGRIAARHLTGSDRSMGSLRGRWGQFRDIALMPTYHPAYLLRSPLEKRKVWDDLKMVAEKLRA